MKSYPSISPDIRYGTPIYAFGKNDGSCMRVEWTQKNGFAKWGRRNGLLDDSNPILKRFPDLFMARYGAELPKIFKDQRWQEVTCFAEFYGPGSFAGNHVESETQEARMFDVSVYKKGFLEPGPFNKLFGDLPVQELLYQGNFTKDLEQQIRQGTLEGMPFEGVVCKGALDRKSGLPLMFKVKSQGWFDKLREHCKGDEALFRLLS